MLKRFVWVSLLLIFFLIVPSQAVYVACTNGTSATIDVNWTFTGAPGTNALIVNIGDEHNALLDFTVPGGVDGTMNQTANMTAGPAGSKGDTGSPGSPGSAATITVNSTFVSGSPNVINVGSSSAALLDFYIPSAGAVDLSGFPFLNGTRIITGKWNYGGYNISNVGDPTTNQDVATKYYVDTHGSNYNASYLTSTYNATYDAKSNYNASYWTGSNYNASYWTGSNYNASYITSASNYNASYLTSTYNATYDSKPSSTYNATYDAKPSSNYNASYWTGSNYNSSYITSTYNATYDTNSNYNASYVTTTNTSYFLTDGSRALTGNMSSGSKYINSLISGKLGSDVVNKSYVDSVVNNYNASYITSTYNSTYDAKPSSTYNATYDAKTNYNSSYITSTYNATYDSKPSSTYNATYDSKPSSTYNATYDAKTNYNASYVETTNGTYVLTNNNTYVKTNNASYVLGSNTTHVVNPVYGYLTLMAGSSLVTTTNPTVMNQWETTTNKNNYIVLNFTDGGAEVGMWMVDFPADWNASANVVFTPIWTAHSGSGTVKFDVAGKLFPDDAALDTALVSIGTSTDTLTATGDIDIAPDTTGAAITSVASGGNTAIIKVTRDSATDTLSGTAELIGLRIKYSRILT